MLCCLPELYIPRINEQSRLLAEIDFLFLTLLYFILPYPTGCSEKLCFPRIKKKCHLCMASTGQPLVVQKMAIK